MNIKFSLLVRLLLIFLSAIMLSSCNRLKSTEQRIVDMTVQASDNGFISRRITGSHFTLQSYYRHIKTAPTADVYIEGDGLAWRRKNRLSKDPTPLESLPFKLALLSQTPAIYLARPCQYQSESELAGCHPKYWSSHRYAEEVVSSLADALNDYQKEFGIKQFRLIGYSGGGALAALLAAKRNDISELITVAANLDHEFWTEHHKVSALTGSLNAYDIAEQISTTMQWHYIGSEDKIIPVAMVERFIEKSGQPDNIQLRVIEGFDHHCCWDENWLKIQREFN